MLTRAIHSANKCLAPRLTLALEVFLNEEGFQVGLEGQAECERRRRVNKFNGIGVCVVLVVFVLSQPLEHPPQWRCSKQRDF